jgi:glycosyltransferase involved in cell wall biosynthesis
MTSPLPYSIVKYYTPAVRQRVRELLTRPWDLIVCDFLVPGGLMPWRGAVPVVLFTHNFETEIWERQRRLATNPLLRWIYGEEARKTARVEKEYAALADLVLTVSPRDTEAFQRLVPAAKVVTIPTGVDTEYFAPRADITPGPADLVFTGSMDWMPNQDAVTWAAGEILPRLWKEFPELKFWVVGRRPSPAIQALGQADPRIRITGSVEDIRPYLHQATLYVVPMRSGSGTRLKIFEAMAAGKAIVSTPVGAEGLPVTDGENICLAADADAMAIAIRRLLGAPAERDRLGRNARCLVEHHYGWEAVGAFFEQQLLAACAAHRPRPAPPEC